MNSKGLLSLFLLLFFAVLFAKISLMQKESAKAQAKTFAVISEMEKAGFLRAEIEVNFDLTVDNSLRKWPLQSIDSEFLKQKMGADIERFARETEKIHAQSVEFFILDDATKEQESFSAEKMSELFSVYVIHAGNAYESEFSFHGGQQRQKMFGAEIRLGNFSQKFFVTPGFSKKALVLPAG